MKISINKIKNYYKSKRTKFKFGCVFSIVERGEIFGPKKNLKLAGYNYIGPGFKISLDGTFTLGEGSIIGPNLTIYTSNHNYHSESLIPYDETTIIKEITIGRGTWIGGGVTLLPGSRIGDCCIIASGEKVRGEVPSFTTLIDGKITPRKNYLTLKKLLSKQEYYMKKKIGINEYK